MDPVDERADDPGNVLAGMVPKVARRERPDEAAAVEPVERRRALLHRREPPLGIDEVGSVVVWATEVLAGQPQIRVARASRRRRHHIRLGRRVRARRASSRGSRTRSPSRGSTSGGSGCRSRRPSTRRRRCRSSSARRSVSLLRSRGRTRATRSPPAASSVVAARSPDRAAGGAGDPTARVGIARDHDHDHAQVGFAAQRVGERVGGVASTTGTGPRGRRETARAANALRYARAMLRSPRGAKG